MSETIMCARCPTKMAEEDAVAVFISPGEPMRDEVFRPENAPVYELCCDECAIRAAEEGTHA